MNFLYCEAPWNCIKPAKKRQLRISRTSCETKRINYQEDYTRRTSARGDQENYNQEDYQTISALTKTTQKDNRRTTPSADHSDLLWHKLNYQCSPLHMVTCVVSCLPCKAPYVGVGRKSCCRQKRAVYVEETAELSEEAAYLKASASDAQEKAAKKWFLLEREHSLKILKFHSRRSFASYTFGQQ